MWSIRFSSVVTCKGLLSELCVLQDLCNCGSLTEPQFDFLIYNPLNLCAQVSGNVFFSITDFISFKCSVRTVA
jgi:hypothetical protein